MRHRTGERPKDRLKATLRLFGFMLKEGPLLILAVCMTLVSNALALYGPRLAGFAIDAMTGKGQVDFASVFRYASYMAAVYAVSAVSGYGLSALMISISRKVVKNIRTEIFKKLTSLPVRYFDTNDTGDILSRFAYDCDTLNASLSTDLVQVLASVVTVFGSLFMMIAISPRLVLIFAFTIPVSAAVTAFITRRTSPLFRLRSQKIGALNGFTEEMITGQKTLKAYSGEAAAIAGFDGISYEVGEAYYKSEFYGSMTGASMGFINNISLALISVFGAMAYIAGHMTLGGISGFVLYGRRFSGPIHEVANIYGELQSALAAAERIFALLDAESEPEDSPDAAELPQAAGKVKVDDVDFGYLPETPVLKNFSLTAEKGSLTAIVGPTGAGKTTMINMLMRFYDIDSGAIYVDGADISLITRDSLRRGYSMVLQDTWLFYGTIYDNIAYGRPDAGKDEVIAAARAVSMHNHIMRLPDGYDTILSDDGSNISKGQMQLLTIARALLMDSKMLILDEATSNVDTRTEVRIQQAMRRLMAGKTCFVVAHRLSTVKNADKILVVDKGSVIESGTHDELMALGGFYKSLYDAQF